MTPTKKLIAGTASAFALVAGMNACGLLGDVEIDVNDKYCEINEGEKYPVRIIDAKEGHIVREGGFKRFGINEEKGTCSYATKSGDVFVYKMK